MILVAVGNLGFGLFDLLAILGRQRVLARLDRALERLGPTHSLS